ncbi:MAG: hypothetical protein ACRCX2_14735 [Paraclostridium sp.]
MEFNLFALTSIIIYIIIWNLWFNITMSLYKEYTRKASKLYYEIIFIPLVSPDRDTIFEGVNALTKIIIFIVLTISWFVFHSGFILAIFKEVF